MEAYWLRFHGVDDSQYSLWPSISALEQDTKLSAQLNLQQYASTRLKIGMASYKMSQSEFPLF